MGLWTKLAVGVVVVAGVAAAAFFVLSRDKSVLPHLQTVAKTGQNSAATGSRRPGKIDWQVSCAGERGDLKCVATQSLFERRSGRTVLSAEIRRFGEKNQTGLLLGLPLNVSLPEGVLVKIGEEPVKRLRVRTCVNSGCTATTALTEKELAAMMNGARLAVAVKDRNNKTITFEMPGGGFDKAYAKLN